ncbi:MAG: YidC/Oxa1 family membrane protein insertase [Butyricicoccus sp.]|nr:YidC/Oxa1 family membrane protein insertase [Butyricicoccus sp.]
MGDIFGIIIVRPFGMILSAIYRAVGSYGLAVILFAVLAKIILMPLSYKNKKSMKKMQALSTKQQELQKKYGKNRERLNEEIQKLYEKEGVSPMSGCLGTFLQLPIMMALYYAVQKPLTYMIGLYEADIAGLANLVGVEISQQNAYTVQLTIAEGLNKFVDAAGNFGAEVQNALVTDGIMQYMFPINFEFLGLNLSQTPSIKEFSILWLIPILSGLTAFISSMAMQKIQGTSQQMQGSMKTMLYMMPLLSVYFGFVLPASIGIYWIANNLLSIVQELILHQMTKNQDVTLVSDTGKKKKKKKEEA